MSEVVAPLLLQKGVSATFFVNSAFVDNRRMGHRNKLSLAVELLRNHRSPALERELSVRLQRHGIRSFCAEAAILEIADPHDPAIEDVMALLEVDETAYLRSNSPYLTSTQIQRLVKQGLTIGGHGVDHTSYASLEPEAQFSQTVECIRFVKETFHVTYGAFAFPFSDDDVSQECFDRLHGSGVVDVSFGTGGMVEPCSSGHVQRVNFESPLVAASHIVAFQQARYLMRSLKKRLADGWLPAGFAGN